MPERSIDLMKRSAKAVSALLASALLIGAAGCGGGGRTPAATGGGNDNPGGTAETTAVTTTVDPNKAIDTEVNYDELANIDEVDTKNEEGAGKLYESGKTAGVCHVLSWFDFTQIQPEKDIAELYATRFGGTVETEIVGSTEVVERLGVLMQSGASPDIMRTGDDYFPSYFINNRFMPMDDWLDIESPVWSGISDIIERYSYNGKHYYWPYAVTATEYGVTYCTAEIENIGGTDPMDLYFSGEWTWDAFEDLMLKWKNFNTDKYPLSMPESLGLQLAATTGVPAIEFKGNEIINNMKDKNVMRAMDFIEKIAREELIWEGWHGPDSLDSWTGTLFFVMPLDWALPCGQEIWFKNNFEGEIRTVPMPRDPNSDTYYMYGATSGYIVPAGALNPQGAASFLLASRMYATDPDVIEKTREEKMYNGGYFYIKCPECKHQFESERDDVDAVCPECNTPRKAKWKLTYTDQQMQVYDDLVDPSKFTFVFDCHRGFGVDTRQNIIDIFDFPAKGTESYNQMLDEYYNVVEAVFDGYRNTIKEAANA